MLFGKTHGEVSSAVVQTEYLQLCTRPHVIETTQHGRTRSTAVDIYIYGVMEQKEEEEEQFFLSSATEKSASCFRSVGVK